MDSTTHDYSPAALSEDDRSAIIAFVRQHPDGVIATVTPEGHPEASTVYFSVSEDLVFSFTTKNATRKAHNIRNHSRVSVSMHDAGSQTVLKIAGHATEISDPLAVTGAFRRTVEAAERTAVDTVPPIARHAAGDYTAFTISPDFIQLHGYGRGDSFRNALEHATDQPEYGNPN